MGDNNNGESGNTINITYETIFELLRREKNRDELQKLNETFYQDIQLYLQEKNNSLLTHSSSSFSDLDSEKTMKQVSNTKKMITELFERREKKIIILALNKVRTASAITDTSAMLHDEKEFFHKLTDTFSEYRNYILSKMISDRSFSQANTASFQNFQSKEIKDKKEALEDQKREDDREKESHFLQINTGANKNTKTLRILSQIPKFMGKELEVYGPFNPDDMASLPNEIADILIKKGRAEELKSE